ncbi:MAG TPA: carboxypeptidase regulatory-like domain-containing protein [Pyrinomonadaceae bacterium]|nr:carboxypeptidase regulatory-like domain-containing protein [Pyrinomonadaceae bacterium]
MIKVWGEAGRALVAVSLLFVCFVCASAQQSLGTLRGQVRDELGGVIVGATVTATDAAGVDKSAVSDSEGRYVFSALAPGLYTVRINQPGFASYENLGVEVQAGRTDPLDIILTVAIEQEEVTVTAEAPVGTEPESNAGAVVLRGADLDALPDDPDDLSDALQALAGPTAGSEEGAQIYVDGFTGGRLPPKESIREIRINRNPFSAEYDRLGYGRVEIFTKPGTDKFRGQAFFNFNDESLNSRSPFASRRAPYQARRYGGNLSGPLASKKASFFLDFERRETDDNDVVRAIVLDPSLAPVIFNPTILTPDRRTTFSPRLDYQLSPTNTLVARYTFERASRQDEGVGDFDLPSRAFDVTTTQHTFQATETAVIRQKVINETRFQYERVRRTQRGDALAPTVRVLEAFTGGGAQVGLSFNNQDNFELQNYTSWTVGAHSLKAGARLRADRLRDVSQQNFAGTFTFAGGAAPQLDANNQIVSGADGRPVTVDITSIERFRRTLLFQNLGLTPAEIRARGGGPTQFSIAGGTPEADVTYVDFSPFIQDDWRVRPNLTLSAGLRYETQNNISSNFDFAPRVAFAWSPSADARNQRTVVRGGFGIFFQRFGQNLTLQTLRSNGVGRRQFVVTDPNSEFLNRAAFDASGGVTNVPTVEELTDFQTRQTIRRLAPDIRTPYTMQTALSVERQLPYRVTLSVSYIGARTLHVLRSRNVNAPLLNAAGRPLTDASGNIARPLGTSGNVFQFESSGVFNQHQLVVNVNNRFSRALTLFATYTLNRARSNAEGAGSFPANQYDLTGEYGRSVQDVRHRLFLGGSINALPWGLRLNPFVVLNSGRPFNITVGRDLNGDTLFTERPAFATDLTRASVRVTPFGAFDLDPQPGQQIIPRNYGEGPSFFSVNMRLGRTFGFGGTTADARAGGGGGGGGGRGGRGGGGRGGGGRGGRGGGGGGGGQGESFGGGGEAQRYNLTLSLNVQNLFNHTNLGAPIGNLSSPLFGQPTAGAGRFGAGGGNQAAGNRRVDVQLRFSF